MNGQNVWIIHGSENSMVKVSVVNAVDMPLIYLNRKHLTELSRNFETNLSQNNI